MGDMTLAQLCEHAKNHWIIYLTRVNFVVCQFYPKERIFGKLLREETVTRIYV
jgi:hypothetical protein